MSLTRIEKYSERGYILKNPPGRLPRKVHWAPLGVWLGSWGRLSMSPTAGWAISFPRVVGFSSSQFLRYEPETSGIDVTLLGTYNDIRGKSNS